MVWGVGFRVSGDAKRGLGLASSLPCGDASSGWEAGVALTRVLHSVCADSFSSDVRFRV